MAHPGPKTIRTPRTRALELGTAVAGFEGAVDATTYDAQAGVDRQLSGGTYQHDDSGSSHSVPSKSVKSPFKLGGK